MRTLIIGDVHGCIRELDLLLAKVGYTSNDRLIFVGDLINKGPSSLAVLQRVKELGAEVTLGNHELALLLDIERGATPKFPREYIEWMRSWPAFIDTKDFLIVHGGLVPGEDYSKSDPRDLARIRLWQDRPWFEFYREKKLVVFGHWAAMGLVWRDNAIGLDTGCVYGKQLSCLELPGRKLTQVDAFEQYTEIISK